MKDNPMVIVIGDIILDEYIQLEYSGLSAEAPISVYKNEQNHYNLGGAANVAVNTAGMELRTCLIGMTGSDYNPLICNLLKEKGIAYHIIQEDRKTTLKRRFVYEGKQIFRYDDEEESECTTESASSIISIFQNVLEEESVSAIILQDYDKGVLTDTLIQKIITISHKYAIPVFADPKRKHFSSYRDIFFFKPNRREFLDAMNLPVDTPECIWIDKAVAFADENRIQEFAITLSEQGILCIHEGELLRCEGYNIKGADVSGAGDTVIAAAVYAYLQGYTLEERIAIMNKAGAAACSKIGVQGVSLQDIEMA